MNTQEQTEIVLRFKEGSENPKDVEIAGFVRRSDNKMHNQFAVLLIKEIHQNLEQLISEIERKGEPENTTPDTSSRDLIAGSTGEQS